MISDCELCSGGVGPMTVAMLMENTVLAAARYLRQPTFLAIRTSIMLLNGTVTRDCRPIFWSKNITWALNEFCEIFVFANVGIRVKHVST